MVELSTPPEAENPRDYWSEPVEQVPIRARYADLLDLQARGMGCSRQEALDHLLRRHLEPHPRPG